MATYNRGFVAPSCAHNAKEERNGKEARGHGRERVTKDVADSRPLAHCFLAPAWSLELRIFMQRLSILADSTEDRRNRGKIYSAN